MFDISCFWIFKKMLKRKVREIQADFNQFSAQQKYVEMIIRHLMLN